MNLPKSTGLDSFKAGSRHVTIFYSDLADFADWTRKLGDVVASRIANRMLTLQEIIITRDGAGQVLQSGGDCIFAVFDTASAALNRSLEIQRILGASPEEGEAAPRLRIGLHMGEVLAKEGERLEIISRHGNRARRVMEAAAPGQIFASEVVVEAGKDFIDVPKEFLAVQYYGEYYLKGVGATDLCEVVDLRFRQPEPPRIPEARKLETVLLGRLELAGYRPLGRLGEGAYGVVYQAEQNETGQRVAVKVLNPALCEDAAARQRFAQEVARLRQLKLPGFVQILEERLEHNPPFFVMELVEGKPADAALAGAAPKRVAKVFQEICSVLEPAHAAGIIHCDLKPENILITAKDAPVILDVGISVLVSKTGPRKTSSSEVLGAPGFLAPEVILGAERGPYTDIYSLGVLLFKALTGQEPFPGESVHQIIQAHLHEDPPLPAALQSAVADGLQRICLKALEKNIAERYQSTREMAGDLGRFLRGEIVRTRPTVYDNLLFHRVRKHVGEINEWTRRGLLNPDEAHRLLGSYDGLQRRGLPAIMEGRLYRLWQTLVYVGGWAVINGALLWLVQHWDELPRARKLLLGSVPAITTFALAAAMWRLERFRLTFMALVVGVLAVPLLIGVWLHEFEVAGVVPQSQVEREVFRSSDYSKPVTNKQLLIIALMTCVAAISVMFGTRTTTHSGQAVLAVLLCYSTCLLWHDLRPNVENEKWATIAVKYLPLLLLIGAVAYVLLNQTERHYQSPPWVYAAAVLLMLIFAGVALHGPKEWTRLASQFWWPVSYLLLAIFGAIQAGLGLLARNYLRHRSRLAALAVVFVGLVEVLAGLSLAGWEGTWPAGWWSPLLFGKAVPSAHWALPAVSIVIALLACRYQMFTFLGVGLIGFAASIHLLGNLYFKEIAGWPKAMMLVGACCFFAALYLELRRTRGNSIDDVVSQSRL